jgi:Ca2+-transporting ATPase
MVFALLITIALQLMVIYLPFFNEIFRTHPLSLKELGITLLTSSIVFWAVEIEKLFKGKYTPRKISPL